MKIFIILFCLFPAIAFAETDTFSCNYTSYSDQDGNHKVKNKFELNFIVDKESGKSYLLGNNGSSEVEMLVSEGQIAFIGISKSGNIITTAIDSKLNSVHSRNSVLLGEILPSQYYGNCVMK